MNICFQYMILVVYCICKWAKAIPVLQDARLTWVDPVSGYNEYEPAGPGTYAFGYDIDDPETENTQFRDEERHPNGTVTGRYGWVAPNGLVYVVRYIADDYGYRATVETVPSYKYKFQRRTNVGSIFGS